MHYYKIPSTVVDDNLTIEGIMSKLFYNDEKPIQLLRKHNLEELFNNSIQVIKLEVEKRPIDFGKFRDIASSVLVSVNSKLREITDPYEKGYLELILKEVADYLLSKITSAAGNSGKLIIEIISALETTSLLNGYNFEALIALLQLNRKGSKYLASRLDGSFYYQWNGNDNDLNELIQTLKAEGWIANTRDFKKLFTNHGDQNLRIAFSPGKIYELLALFDELKSNGLITPRGCKGHFYPLRRYLVDLENNFLFENDPKTAKMIAKRNRSKWEKMTNTAKSWISGFKVQKNTKLPWSR
ncbi:hypothetical protein KK083_09665 [Fulvivirgaceae bacterium PWU4]|uniref:Uncharacterized protein n=1 Tax=Chryseosolibacter histidini TaxID=2782349 RepID=A0AAP2DIT4_9BACT|nr:hypothetical protein [Chryseosolibacter histidini]MBT1697141.1 hypothetical protein [Chryseosolibacter histidini]